MPRRRDDKRPLRRRTAFRDPNPFLLVVCEGAVTERAYLESLRRHFANRLVRIRFDDRGAVPLTLVERAIELRTQAEADAARTDDGFLRYDEVWCVFDVDEHPNLDASRRLAIEAGIEIALSNPCFELWLLLHFVTHTAYVTRSEARRS